MTPEQAQKLLPFVKARAEGKEIQVEVCGGSIKWQDIDPPRGSDDAYTKFSIYCTYRIKPEARWRPWTYAEIHALPLGTLVKNTGSDNIYLLGHVDLPARGMVFISCRSSGQMMYFETLFWDYVHSIDHGVTWNRCGVLEQSKD